MSASPTLACARGLAAVRAADALLRALGAAPLTLRIPAPIVTAGTASEIGLAAPAFQDVALAPAALRSLANSKPELARARFELLISASAVQQQMELNSYSSADDFFSSALGFVYNGDLLRIEQFAADDFAGATYLYRVIASR